MCPDRLAHGAEAPLAGLNALPADDQQPRTKDIDQRGGADTQPAPRVSEYFSSQFVTPFGRGDDGL